MVENSFARIRTHLVIVAAFVSIAGLSTSTSGQPGRHTGSSTAVYSFSIIAENPADLSRQDEAVEVDLSSIKRRFPSFNERAFFVTLNGEEIPSQLTERFAGPFESGSVPSEKITFLSSFNPNETKHFTIFWRSDTVEERAYPKRTQATLGMKVDYKMVDGCYTGGRFVDVDSTTVPTGHFAHDALYRIEGPGWESEKIAYRLYLDSRSRNDIFGKKTHELVLKKIGENDLVSDSKESYTKMLDWGMDIFKVGESLGIGSIAMWHDSKAVTVSDVGKTECGVFNGAIRSGVFTKYSEWKVGNKTYDLSAEMSISAGSRLTKVCAQLSGSGAVMCTGLAKHDACDFLKSPPESTAKWAYFALYGKQSLSGDKLGIMIFYRSADKVKLTEDGESKIVVLRPVKGQITYYFGAAWEAEPGGIKDEKQFRRYLDETVLKLSNPIRVSF